MDAAFYFSFYEPDVGDNEPAVRHLGFYVSHMRPWKEIPEEVYACGEVLGRRYGEHNFLIDPDSGINVFGYESYEVDTLHHDELMEKWRQEFLRISPKCVIGAVLDLEIDPAAKPLENFQYIKDTHEHQQAQRLRDTLTAHITTSASTAAVKKI